MTHAITVVNNGGLAVRCSCGWSGACGYAPSFLDVAETAYSHLAQIDPYTDANALIENLQSQREDYFKTPSKEGQN